MVKEDGGLGSEFLVLLRLKPVLVAFLFLHNFAHLPQIGCRFLGDHLLDHLESLELVLPTQQQVKCNCGLDVCQCYLISDIVSIAVVLDQCLLMGADPILQFVVDEIITLFSAECVLAKVSIFEAVHDSTRVREEAKDLGLFKRVGTEEIELAGEAKFQCHRLYVLDDSGAIRRDLVKDWECTKLCQWLVVLSPVLQRERMRKKRKKSAKSGFR